MSAGDREVFVDFYDYRNLGDDLLFATLVRRYPHVRFVFIEDQTDGSAFAGLPNVRRQRKVRYVDGILGRLRIPFRVNALRRSRLVARSPYVVRLGGSLYMERGEWRRNAARDAALLRSRGGALFLNGNFGPWQSPEFLATYEDIFSRALDVTVRDSASRDELRAVDQVRLAPDLLFSLALPGPAGTGAQGSVPTQEAGGDVVVSMVDLTGRDGLSAHRQAYESGIAELVDDLVVRGGRRVTLMSFCPMEGDEAVIERVLALLPAAVRSSVGTHFYRGDLDAALGVLRRAQTVVATRFHAMVLGLAFGARVCSIEYSNKVTNTLLDLGIADRGWKLAEFADASREERYARIGALEGLDPLPVGRSAEAHFAVLDELLGAPA